MPLSRLGADGCSRRDSDRQICPRQKMNNYTCAMFFLDAIRLVFDALVTLTMLPDPLFSPAGMATFVIPFFLVGRTWPSRLPGWAR
jgi:hypothetical protein